ncbi:MAG TPA: SDR family oxidoreductase [Candidatus Binatia bacterium]|nr:SDR family oxidoreductase [Candidatus Binatia bacterium]
MRGRVCVVTGASSGIGKAAARELARTGATIVLVCRNAQRAEAARAGIRTATGNETLDVLLADLSSQAEIRRLARELLARYPQIHVLINNAGVLNRQRTTTVDGIETVFAVNHLAYFLLTHLLLERLIISEDARIINVASAAHYWGNLDFNDLQNVRRYRALQVYGQSKLCNILFTRELARRIVGTGVTVNCLHPGGVATGLGWNNGWWAVLIAKALQPFFRTPEQGADSVVYLATAPAAAAVSGKYFYNRREIQPSPAAQDDEAAKQLWQISAELTGITL